MFSQTIKAGFSALRLLFNRWSTLPLLVVMYAALLGAAYLFVSTREATVTQLALTLGLMIIAPVLFFGLQAVSVNYASGTVSSKALAKNCLRVIVVSIPLIVMSFLTLYGLGKIDGQPAVVTAIRYLLAGVIVPLLAIQLWVAASQDGLRSLLKRLHQVAARAFAPQSVLVYACGALIFGVAPYLLIFYTTPSERVWLEVSLLGFRLLVSALLILFGWVTTVGTLSILAKR